jgi:FAD/FMN-containing dehydrogenase
VSNQTSRPAPAAVPPMEWNFTTEEAKALQAAVAGSVVLPSDADYHLRRQAFVVNYQAFPQIIVYCKNFEDVARALEFAQRHELSPVCRSGGHSAAGLSVNNEMVIDLSDLNYINVDPKSERAIVGAGTKTGPLNAELHKHQLHVPGGACDAVAIAGFMQGGGFGYTSQIYGLNCDNVVEALVMLADGSIVVASDQYNKDLFWALRGGAGNNFGVLLQVTYRLHRPNQLWGFGISWKVEESRDGLATALEILQRSYTGSEAPSGMAHQSTFNFVGEDRYFMLRGMFLGTPADGKRALSKLLATDGAIFDIDLSAPYMELQDHLNTHPEAPIYAPHSRTQADSRYIARYLSRDEWRDFIDLFRQSPNRGNFIGLEGYSGEITRPKSDGTAFRHRDALLDAYIWVLWQNEDQERKSLEFLHKFRDVLGRYSNGHAYQNYPNRASIDYRWMYWGENFPGLLRVKRKYDPHGLFKFGQTISDPPEGVAPIAIDAARAAVPDTSAPIQYPAKRPARP